MTNYKRGVVKERECEKILEAAGYYAQRSAGSHGLWDVVGVGPTGVRLIQIKRCKKGGAWKREFELACEQMRQLPSLPYISCEVWVWEDNEGWIKRWTA